MNFDLVSYQIDHRLIALVMLGLLAAAGEIGFRSGSSKRGSEDSYRSLVSGTSAAMLGLLALLLGFTLSMGVSPWNDRHEVIVNETNAIGTRPPSGAAGSTGATLQSVASTIGTGLC